MIQAELAGETGSLIDLLEKRVGFEFSAVNIVVEPNEITAETGRPADIDISVFSSIRSRIGQVPLNLVGMAGEGDVVFSLMTSPVGTYEEPVNMEQLDLGKELCGYKNGLSKDGPAPGIPIFSASERSPHRFTAVEGFFPGYIWR